MSDHISLKGKSREELDEYIETLPPTEELVMEVLIARARCGERIWTFSSTHQRTINSLEAKGLVFGMSGVVEKTLRAGISDDIREELLSYPYVLPILAQQEDNSEETLERKVDELLKRTKKILKNM